MEWFLRGLVRSSIFAVQDGTQFKITRVNYYVLLSQMMNVRVDVGPKVF